MDPNSIHQLWSKWLIIVKPQTQFSPSFEDMKLNTARCIRTLFGSTGQCQIRKFPKAWVIDALVESQFHPLDRDSFNTVSQTITQFFKMGFGYGTNVIVKSKLMAGERLDNQPADQMIILPTLKDS